MDVGCLCDCNSWDFKMNTCCACEERKMMVVAIKPKKSGRAFWMCWDCIRESHQIYVDILASFPRVVVVDEGGNDAA